MINTSFIAEIKKSKSGNLSIVMLDQNILSVSKTYKKNFTDLVLR